MSNTPSDGPNRRGIREYSDSHRRLAREIFWENHDRATYECPDCLRTEPECVNSFEVHHKSGVPVDNSPENLIALCRPCHNIREGKNPSLEETFNLRNQVNDVDGADAIREHLSNASLNARPVAFDRESINKSTHRHITTNVQHGDQIMDRCDLCGGLFPKESWEELIQHVYDHNEHAIEDIDPFHGGTSVPLPSLFSDEESGESERELVSDDVPRFFSNQVIPDGWTELKSEELGYSYFLREDEWEGVDSRLDAENENQPFPELPPEAMEVRFLEMCEEEGVEPKGPIPIGSYVLEADREGEKSKYDGALGLSREEVEEMSEDELMEYIREQGGVMLSEDVEGEPEEVEGDEKGDE